MLPDILCVFGAWKFALVARRDTETQRTCSLNKFLLLAVVAGVIQLIALSRASALLGQLYCSLHFEVNARFTSGGTEASD